MLKKEKAPKCTKCTKNVLSKFEVKHNKKGAYLGHITLSQKTKCESCHAILAFSLLRGILDFFVQLVLCPAIRLFNLIGSQPL